MSLHLSAAWLRMPNAITTGIKRLSPSPWQHENGRLIDSSSLSKQLTYMIFCKDNRYVSSYGMRRSKACTTSIILLQIKKHIKLALSKPNKINLLVVEGISLSHCQAFDCQTTLNRVTMALLSLLFMIHLISITLVSTEKSGQI